MQLLAICTVLVAPSFAARPSAVLLTRGTASARDSCSARMIFGKSDAQKRAIEEQWEAQQAMLARRRNPRAREQYFKNLEDRREEETRAWKDKLAWQRKADSDSYNKLDEFKRRKQAGSVKKLGYEDQPKGGIPLPLASFGVGGEFGVGGKYDNGERFDLRLPYVEMGWVDPKDKKKTKRQQKGSAQSKRGATPKPGLLDWLFGKS